MKKKTLEEKIKLYPIDCYSRIVGWLSPVKNWNKGKVSEWESRVEFNVNKDIKKEKNNK